MTFACLWLWFPMAMTMAPILWALIAAMSDPILNTASGPLNSNSFFFFLYRATPESELQLLAYATATTKPDLSHLCDLRLSSCQHQICNPLSKSRNLTSILVDTGWVCYHWATMGTPWIQILNIKIWCLMPCSPLSLCSNQMWLRDKITRHKPGHLRHLFSHFPLNGLDASGRLPTSAFKHFFPPSTLHLFIHSLTQSKLKEYWLSDRC